MWGLTGFVDLTHPHDPNLRVAFLLYPGAAPALLSLPLLPNLAKCRPLNRAFWALHPLTGPSHILASYLEDSRPYCQL